MKNNRVNYCVGIDGCKDGWVVVYCPPLAFNEAKAKHYKRLSLLENDFGNQSSIIIDMPIGLEVTEPNRQCDMEARKFLGPRGSTIFSPPCLDAINSMTYEEAKSINHKKTGKSISKQSWFLTKKILETKNFIEGKSKLLLREGHPECSFAQYAGKPILDRKKGMHGLFKRLDILKKLNFNIPKLVEMIPQKVEICVDDLLDAAILCWTANRLHKGESRTFPSSESQEHSLISKCFITV